MWALSLSTVFVSHFRRVSADLGYTASGPVGGQGNAGERPEHQTGGRDGRTSDASPPLHHPGAKRQTPGSGAAPQFSSKPLAPPRFFVRSRSSLDDLHPRSHLSALTSGMSIFVPGFAITNTASRDRQASRLPVLGRRHRVRGHQRSDSRCRRRLPINLLFR